ncbi:Spc24 subunit of Ndc80-domain-containing protein [Gamsiella multidivaricata]|uniref:Spc24 subunit of Ndc80-domain-containing protein n=1 Tax=Gamsiella multidivaricata TaxID=101098 RepID=UPI00221FCBE2|nr:Spc24 subunit of Ndc80-domain-containing protein [Gamsiella multidivaricata]KAG0359150.1 kinetochore-associated Ndc80 complex subunit spc24 [Gamsiella multidivaricata]KAI7821248.1 Spc24 subunit of Ndc80-domain-containing protein [Gamsiella multidivaricata]
MQQQSGPVLDDDLVELIQDVASQFSQKSTSDAQSFEKTIHHIRETETLRREMLQDARSLLQKMSRNLQLSRSKGQREHVDPESLNHDEWMVKMDQKKFSVAKSIQNLDQNIASLEAEVHQLRMYSLELDYKSPGTSTNNGRNHTSATAAAAAGGLGSDKNSSRTGGAEGDIDGMLDEDDVLDDTVHAMAVLRLQLYRGLGIEMLENELGVYSRARIRSQNRNEVHLVKFDKQLSPFFETNLIWDFAS